MSVASNWLRPTVQCLTAVSVRPRFPSFWPGLMASFTKMSGDKPGRMFWDWTSRIGPILSGARWVEVLALRACPGSSKGH